MTPEERRRRALATGLAPWLEADQVVEAVALWQRDFADRPRFSLQGYVSELSRRFDLAHRRHDLHLGLVQAMSLPDRQLVADPLAGNGEGAGTDPHPATRAFQALMRTLWAGLGETEASTLRLDQSTDLRRGGLASAPRASVDHWLNHPRADLAPLDRDTLRTLLNRSYVLLCERYGPVRADRLLKEAADRVRREHPALGPALNGLL